ncbi:hypothetical protein [Miltoncostaea marina]|uniref:hypothetical protein n=1 Tax=Miltoncostaea marina TaxID=2843215 RepID=UPI001C3E54A3|nr:hypothetical protein [Miltoncostaea marina]
MGVPVWLVLLLLVPRTGLGPMPSLFLATVLTAAVVVAVERRRSRHARAAAAPHARPAERRPMSALAGAGIALGAIVVLAYVVFVLVAA